MKKIYFGILVLAALVTACELPDNKDPKAPTDVPPSTLLTQAEVSFVSLIDNISMNVNIGRFLAQYASQVNYTDESRYDFTNRSIPDTYWSNTYQTLRDFKEVKDLVGQLEGNPSFNRNRDNQLAVADIMEVYMYQAIVDYLADVPYTEALMGAENKTPKFDDAATIYSDLMTRLRADIATLTTGADDGSWGSEDLLFGGDVEMWKKAAASILLRMGMRLSDIEPSTAQSALSDALSAGVFEDGETMELVWLGVTPHVNTIYNSFIVGGRFDYAPSLTMTSMMVGLSDPRLPLYFSMVDTSSDASGKYAYLGLEYGLTAASPYASVSHWSDQMFDASFPAVLIDYVEIQFLLAEAAARGWTTPMTAAEHYAAGITASIVKWGGEAADAVPYMAQPDVTYDQARWKELIGTQKWLALYNRGNEGYASYRIFDWPVLPPPEDMTQADIPLRWPYPFNEKDLNLDNYNAAASAIGGDDVRTQLFWDVTPNSANPSPN